MATGKKSKRTYLTYHSFKWSHREYSLKELLDTFSHRLPFLVEVTQGHMAIGKDDEMHCFDSEEVYWLRKVVVQPRVVVKTMDDKYFSIPKTYKSRVTPYITDAQGAQADRVCTIAELLEQPKGYRVFEFKDDVDKEVFDATTGLGTTYHMGVLEIVDQYDERFIMAHHILLEDTPDPTIHGRGPMTDLCKGPLYPLFKLIPLYMPITVAIGMAMAKGSGRAFYQTMLDMHRCVKDSNDDYSKQLKKVSDIMLFDGKPAKGDYEYIHCLKFLRSFGDDGVEKSRTFPKYEYQKPLFDEMDDVPNLHHSVSTPNARNPKKHRSKISKLMTTTFRKMREKAKKPPPRIKETQLNSSAIHKNRAPTPPLCSAHSDDTDSIDSDDSDYEIIPTEYFNKICLEPLPLNQRSGPVALGIPAEGVLDELQNVLARGTLPKLALPDDIDESPPHSPSAVHKTNIKHTIPSTTPAPALPRKDFHMKKKVSKTVPAVPVKTPVRGHKSSDNPIPYETQSASTQQSTILPRQAPKLDYEFTELDQYNPPTVSPVGGSKQSRNLPPVPSPKGKSPGFAKNTQPNSPTGIVHSRTERFVKGYENTDSDEYVQPSFIKEVVGARKEVQRKIPPVPAPKVKSRDQAQHIQLESSTGVSNVKKDHAATRLPISPFMTELTDQMSKVKTNKQVGSTLAVVTKHPANVKASRVPSPPTRKYSHEQPHVVTKPPANVKASRVPSPPTRTDSHEQPHVVTKPPANVKASHVPSPPTRTDSHEQPQVSPFVVKPTGQKPRLETGKPDIPIMAEKTGPVPSPPIRKDKQPNTSPFKAQNTDPMSRMHTNAQNSPTIAEKPGRVPSPPIRLDEQPKTSPFNEQPKTSPFNVQLKTSPFNVQLKTSPTVQSKTSPFKAKGIDPMSRLNTNAQTSPTVAVVKPQNSIPKRKETPVKPIRKPGGDSSFSMENVTKVCDIPLDINDFSISDVSKCLTLLGLPNYVKSFQDSLIDGSFLMDLDQNILLEQFNFNTMEVKKLLKFIKGWRPK